MSLFLRLLRHTLLPAWPTGPGTLRRRGLLLLFVPAFLLVQTLHWIGFLLDELLFPGYRRVEVREPLFVVGLPRSGTSFLQRVLALDTDRFTTLRLWELLLAPSVTERRLWMGAAAADRVLGRPGFRLLRWLERRGMEGMDAIHAVSLSDPEEDFLLLLPVFACFLLVVPFPYHREIWKLARFDQLPERERSPLMGFYRRALQRHLYLAGPQKTLLSKNPSFTPFLRSLLESFPDAKVLCCVRDPAQVVPSQLSSLRPAAALFGYRLDEPSLRDRFVDLLGFYSRHALEVLPSLPESRQAFVSMEEIKRDTAGFVLGIYRRFGWEAGPGFRARLEREAVRGEAYRSRHRYSLEEFGLSPAALGSRFRALEERFGWGPGSPGGEGK
jgi:hypothetical protein